MTINEVKEVFQNQVKEQKVEYKEREKRLNNVIIFSLTESTSQQRTTKQQYDEQTSDKWYCGLFVRNMS